MTKQYRLDFLERWSVLILAGSHALLGLYYMGPWYITESHRTPTGDSPTLNLFPNEMVVNAWGAAFLISSLFLGALACKATVNVTLLGHAILANFLLRCFQQVGTLVAIDSWLPPNYVPRIVMVLLLGVLWVRVRVRARVTQ